MKTKSIRLNKSIRTEIVENIMESYKKENVRPEEPKDSIKDLHAAVVDWYLDTNSKNINKFKKLLKEFPETINQNSYIAYIDDKKEYYNIYFGIKDIYVSGMDYVYYPTLHSGTVIDLSNKDTVVPERLQKVIDSINGNKKEERLKRKAVSDYDRELLAYRQDVQQVIDGCNTSGQLIEVWEEVEQFLPKGVSDPSDINLPSVNVAALNRRLGV